MYCKRSVTTLNNLFLAQIAHNLWNNDLSFNITIGHNRFCYLPYFCNIYKRSEFETCGSASLFYTVKVCLNQVWVNAIPFRHCSCFFQSEELYCCFPIICIINSFVIHFWYIFIIDSIYLFPANNCKLIAIYSTSLIESYS